MVGRGFDTNLSCPICDPILKELEGPTKDRSAYWRRFCKVDIITSTLHNRWGYIQEAYNATRIQHHNTEKQHPTTDENKQKTQTTTTLLAEGAVQEPIP